MAFRSCWILASLTCFTGAPTTSSWSALSSAPAVHEGLKILLPTHPNMLRAKGHLAISILNRKYAMPMTGHSQELAIKHVSLIIKIAQHFSLFSIFALDWVPIHGYIFYQTWHWIPKMEKFWFCTNVLYFENLLWPRQAPCHSPYLGVSGWRHDSLTPQPLCRHSRIAMWLAGWDESSRQLVN